MSKFLGLNISDELDNAIAQRVKETKKTKTEIAIMALQKELDIQTVLTLGDRVEILEQKVCEIEGKI